MIELQSLQTINLDDAEFGDVVLPNSKYSDKFLIGSFGGAPYAIFLDGQYQFDGFPIGQERGSRFGLRLKGARFEGDLASAVSGQDRSAQRGDLVSRGRGLYLVGSFRDGGFPRQRPFLVAGEESNDEERTFLSHWELVRYDERDARLVLSAQYLPKEP